MTCAKTSNSAASIVEQQNLDPKRTNVLFICDEWNSSKGCLSTFNREFAVNLAKTASDSIKVHCYVSQSDELSREDAKQHGVNLITARRIPGFTDPLDWLKFPPHVQELPNPDIVVGHGRKFGTPAYFIVQAAKCKWVQFVHVFREDLSKFKVTVESASLDPIAEYENWKRRSEIELCKAADLVVAVGSRLQKKYSRSLPNVKVEIITPGIIEKFSNESSPVVKDKSVVLKTFNIFMFGRASFEDHTLKGYEIVANAIGSLGMKFELTFVVSSSGEHRNIKQWFLDNTCISRKQLTIRSYCNKQDERKEMFHESDLVMLPYRTEGFGLVALEVISAGVPVLLAGESGIAEALQKVEGGMSVIVKSDDVEEWARRIQQLSNKSPEERQNNAKLLRENYKKTYPWSRECKKFERMIHVVPPEITARGNAALEAYNKALSEGKSSVKRLPIMFVGKEQTGKTSLKESLRGETFKKTRNRTEGIDVDHSHFKVTAEIWKTGEKDQGKSSGAAISYEYHAARLTVDNMMAYSSDASNTDLQSSKIETDPESIQKSMEQELQPSKISTDPKSIQKSMVQDLQPAGKISTDQESIQTSGSGEQVDKPNPTHASLIEMPDDIATIIEKLLKEVGEVEDEDDIYSVLWDFGGQSVYYTTHPVFLTEKAMYLLVFDLSQIQPTLQEKANPVEIQGFKDSSSQKTSLDYLDFWMSSIASLASQSETGQEISTSENLPEALPPVFLVGTHADTLYRCGGDPCALASDVLDNLQTKPYAKHLVDDVFVVDNTKSGGELECPEVVRLRNGILAVAKELPQMKETIPVRWLKFEKALQAMKKDGHKMISLASAKQIASEVCNIVEDEEFNTLLNFLHDQRILIHFDDTPELNKLVVLDLQWLINVFKMVITHTSCPRKGREVKQLWAKLQRDGILDEKLLEQVWGPLLKTSEIKNQTYESILAIMEKFSLLCPWPSSDASSSKQYLVPSMLMVPPPEAVMKLVSSAQIPSLFIKFESGLVPPGLFPRLVLQFFEWGKKGFWRKVNPQLYHNFARFYPSGDRNCSVILLCRSSLIEIVVHKGNLGVELAERFQATMTLVEDVHHETFDEICARDVCRQLGLMLESMRNEFCWLKNMKYELSVICPVCCHGDVVSHCRVHHTQGCKQEECLHFLSLFELCNAKEDIFCTKPGSAFARNNRVEVQQFAPWFLSLGGQLAIGANESGDLTNAEGNEDNSASLPSEVDSLLSPSCEAREVVLQLTECLQLDQACLNQPEPGTKSLIRCLVRKAKRSDRLDVVKYLREITPAGTTGPLLEERLDVRQIPCRQRRELTIFMTVGGRWKQVAEELGLTPMEIDFLDERTLNPFDAVLGFIGSQRYCTVGRLYDVLNKCGFPMVADFL